MAADLTDLHTDVFTTFGNQVESELRQIQDPGYQTWLKRNIVNNVWNSRQWKE